MVTHDLQEASRVADFIYVMKSGKAIQSGVFSDIYHSPKDHTIAKFSSEFSSTLQLDDGLPFDGILAARK